MDGGYIDGAIRALTGVPTFSYDISAITNMNSAFTLLAAAD
jgi:hypothetical protein